MPDKKLLIPLVAFSCLCFLSACARTPPPAPTAKTVNWRNPLWLAKYEGAQKEEALAFTCPDGMVFIPSGSVDSVYGSRWNKDTPQKGDPRRVGAFCMDRFEFPNERYAMPQVHVSWTSAARLCSEAGKRLCYEDEWELACTMGKDQPYSYGPERVAHQCNSDYPANDVSAVAPAGSRIECRNDYGVFDLNGNVSEWVMAVDAGLGGSSGVLRGDTAWISEEYGGDCFSRHTHSVVATEFGDDGFRCCTQARAGAKK